MIIDAQSKESIVNFNNIINIHIEKDTNSREYIIYYETETFEKILGRYSSLERCEKILSEILDIYLHVEEPVIYNMPKE